MRLALAFTLAGCHAIAPPPMLAMHADTAAEPKGTTTVVAVLGFAGTIFGGGGYGFALRAEHQYSTRTALGIEVSAGRGSEARRKGDEEVRHWLVGLRGYGRSTARSHDWVAATYGLGVSYLDTGLVTGTANAGVGVSYLTDNVEPVAQLGFAGALPLRRGEPYGEERTFAGGRERRPGYAEPELYLCADGGILGNFDDDRSRMSFDFGVAGGLIGDALVFGISGAGARRTDP